MAVQDKSANKFINTISADFEIWEEVLDTGSKYYLVAQLPSFEGTGGVFTWRYEITDWNAIKQKTPGNNLVPNVIVDSAYNIVKGTSSIAASDYENSFYFGNANQLLFNKAEAGAEPYDHLVEALQEEAKYSEWILSEDEDGRLDFLALAIENALEGKKVREADLEKITWYRNTPPAERKAAELFASDPSKYKEDTIKAQQAIVDGMIARGVQTINNDVVTGLTSLYMSGKIADNNELTRVLDKMVNDRVRYTLDPEVQAVLTGQTFDTILQTRDIAAKIDSVIGPEQSQYYDIDEIAKEAEANPVWYSEVFLPQLEETFQNKYTQFKGSAVKSYSTAAGAFRSQWQNITGQMPDETSSAWQSFFATNDVKEREDIAFAESARLGTQTYRDTLKSRMEAKFGKPGQRATGGGSFR